MQQPTRDVMSVLLTFTKNRWQMEAESIINSNSEVGEEAQKSEMGWLEMGSVVEAQPERRETYGG
jgi:hypothetical protein